MKRAVWFQLVNEVGKKLTPVHGVTCSTDATVFDLQIALKSMFQDSHLAGLPPPEVGIFENEATRAAKQAMEVYMPLASLGESQEHPLIVVVECKQRCMVDVEVNRNLDRVQVEFTSRELDYIFDSETVKYCYLRSPTLTTEEALMIRERARAAIKTFTRKDIHAREGVLLDGPIQLNQGQAKYGLYYAYSPSGGAMFAKVYGETYKSTFRREVEVNRALGSHPNIVQFYKSFSIPNRDNVQRHVIVMPFFARSAADLLAQCTSSIGVRALATIAPDCVRALCHIHSKGYCFADLKPSNIMLHGGEGGGATLVDFGSSVPLGDAMVEITDPYCLDVAASRGSENLDWTCLGTTLMQLSGIDITGLEYPSRSHVVRAMKCGCFVLNKFVQNFIICCLQNPCQTRIESALEPLLKCL